mmetsp:Transcript_19029/g.44398  ORF Transcript_19029/g.44398 Transcript_19029/m.44398 type:complete len:685 (+) Transcript_19029:94-2148(+)
MAAAQKEGEKLVHESQALLNRTLQQLNESEQWSIQWPCSRLSCKNLHRPGVSDNARQPCHLDVRDDRGAEPLGLDRLKVTPRDILQHNKDAEREKRWDEVWHLSVKCRMCNAEARRVLATDTKEKLHLDLREVVTHDKTLPLIFDPQKCHPDIPADAAEVCRLAHLFPGHIITGEVIQLMDASLREGWGGELRRILEQKMNAKPVNERHLMYLRVGVGLQALGPITAILEIWPVDHSSPKHQHGGCAGSIRVLHGTLTVKLFDSVFSDDAMTWRSGDGGLPDLPRRGTNTLHLVAGQTTWLNRANWFVHEVTATHQLNQSCFGMSLHVYKSCSDEFAFVTSQNEVQLGNPKNDLFWNIDLPGSDPRLNEGVQDFEVAIGLQGSRTRRLDRPTNGGGTPPTAGDASHATMQLGEGAGSTGGTASAGCVTAALPAQAQPLGHGPGVAPDETNKLSIKQIISHIQSNRKVFRALACLLACAVAECVLVRAAFTAMEASFSGSWPPRMQVLVWNTLQPGLCWHTCLVAQFFALGLVTGAMAEDDPYRYAAVVAFNFQFGLSSALWALLAFALMLCSGRWAPSQPWSLLALLWHLAFGSLTCLRLCRRFGPARVRAVLERMMLVQCSRKWKIEEVRALGCFCLVLLSMLGIIVHLAQVICGPFRWMFGICHMLVACLVDVWDLVRRHFV